MSDLIAWLRAQMDDDERDWTPYLIGPAQIGNPTARQILADVAAKRAIIDAYEAALEAQDEDPHDETRTADASTLGYVVELLAQPYAGRPGWREEWRT